MSGQAVAKKTHQTLDEAAPAKVISAEIEFHHGPILLPFGHDGKPMSLREAVTVLETRLEQMEQYTEFYHEYDVEMLDGAHALSVVLQRKYGWLPAAAGCAMVNTEVAFGKSVSVPWGQFKLPGTDDGTVKTSYARKGARWVFQMIAEVKKKDKPVVDEIAALVTKELRLNSIYRGKAFKVNFKKPGEAPEITFMDLSHVDEEKIVFSADVHDAVYTNLVTPLRRIKEMAENNFKVKRGIALAGTYGVGKSLAMTLAAKVAEDNGITCIYIAEAKMLPQAIEFAKKYQTPAVLIEVEDIDRETSGDRNVEMDHILNMIDGIDTKNSNIIVVLTTNELESIHPAMLRPGRLDAVIKVLPPDAVAAGRLIKVYGGELIGIDVDLDKIGGLLAGQIPAIIEEVVQRAKLAQLRRNAVGVRVSHLSEAALMDAAKSMIGQVDLLNSRINAAKPVNDPFSVSLGNLIKETTRQGIKEAIG